MVIFQLLGFKHTSKEAYKNVKSGNYHPSSRLTGFLLFVANKLLETGKYHDSTHLITLIFSQSLLVGKLSLVSCWNCVSCSFKPDA